MVARMSKVSNPLFKNPKVTLGFAGVVVAIALVASIVLEEFVVTPEIEGGETAIVEIDQESPEKVARNDTSATPAGWAEDGFADDWDTESIDWATGEPKSAGSSDDEISQPEFGEYSPEDTGASSASPRRDGGDATVRSGAVRGAPAVRAPRSGQNNDGQVALAN